MPQQFRLVGTVVDAFNVRTRGLVVVLGDDLTGRIRAGSRIQLRTSDHRTVETHVKSIELIKRLDLPSAVGLLLTDDVEPDALRKGTEIWGLAD